jgi:hypothetical protein
VPATTAMSRTRQYSGEAQSFQTLAQLFSGRTGSKPPPASFSLLQGSSRSIAKRTTDMSVKGQIKEATGFVKEELNEHGKSPESKQKAQEGRDLRNEGRVEDGKAPKTTKPGTGH